MYIPYLSSFYPPFHLTDYVCIINVFPCLWIKINDNVVQQSSETMPSSLPALPFEEGGADDDKQN
jgi:hypothetical protein